MSPVQSSLAGPQSSSLLVALQSTMKYASVSAAYPDASTRRDEIRKDYGISGLSPKILPCDVDGHGRLILSTIKVTRHPRNDRIELSENNYHFPRVISVAFQTYETSWDLVGSELRDVVQV